MDNNSIQMATSAGHVVAYMITPIFKHIIDCVQLYFDIERLLLFSFNTGSAK